MDGPHDLVAPWTAKPKPRKRRTRDVLMWTFSYPPHDISAKGLYTEDEMMAHIKGGHKAKWHRVTIHGLTVRK